MNGRYAVVGNPVAHSLSPRIHALFAEQTGERITYERLLAPLDAFAATVEAFFRNGGAGLNVTLPFKEEAFRWVDEHDELAGTAGAVNVIVPVGGRLRGSNTDGIGLVRDLERQLGRTLGGLRIALVGAGGAARGVLGPLLGERPAAVVMANRTLRRAREVVDRLEDPRLSATELSSLRGPFDVVVNATSASLSGTVPDLPSPIARGAFCYDMAYALVATPFMRWAASAGAAACVDGLGMLVEQAAESFLLWRGRRPDAVATLVRLRVELGVAP